MCIGLAVNDPNCPTAVQTPASASLPHFLNVETQETGFFKPDYRAGLDCHVSLLNLAIEVSTVGIPLDSFK